MRRMERAGSRCTHYPILQAIQRMGGAKVAVVDVRPELAAKDVARGVRCGRTLRGRPAAEAGIRIFVTDNNTPLLGLATRFSE